MDEKPFETMNVIPFVDIMLVLLTIVLTTSSFIASGRIPVNLPQASQSMTETDRSVIVEMSLEGGIYLNGREVTLEGLREGIKSLGKDTAFVVRADRDIRLQSFIDVADLLKQMEFTRVAVQTKSGK